MRAPSRTSYYHRALVRYSCDLLLGDFKTLYETRRHSDNELIAHAFPPSGELDTKLFFDYNSEPMYT